MIVTENMIGMEVLSICGGCHGTGWHNAWRNRRPIGKVPCFQCGGSEGTYRVDAEGNHVSGVKGQPGRGWYTYPLPDWMLGKPLGSYKLRTFA